MIVFRDCTQYRHAPQCEVKVIENQRIKMCYETCDTDGCNAGNKGVTASLYMTSNKAIVTQPFVMMLTLITLFVMAVCSDLTVGIL